MEFAIDQPLKIYSGGLGFSRFSYAQCIKDLKQNVVGIGILWKYGYYDQVRRHNNEMDTLWQESITRTLFEETGGIELRYLVEHHPVKGEGFETTPPNVFGNAPVILSTGSS